MLFLIPGSPATRLVRAVRNAPTEGRRGITHRGAERAPRTVRTRLAWEWQLGAAGDSTRVAEERRMREHLHQRGPAGAARRAGERWRDRTGAIAAMIEQATLARRARAGDVLLAVVLGAVTAVGAEGGRWLRLAG